MAVDTQNKRRSVSLIPTFSVPPVPDGAIDAPDRAHAAWIYRGLVVPEVEDIEGSFSRTPTYVVSLEVTGDLAGSQTFYFSPKEGAPLNLQLNMDVRPYLLDADGRPTRVEPDKATTERANITISLADDPDAPDFDSTVFSVYQGGSFWNRLELAQPDMVGSRVIVRRGFVAGGFGLNDFTKIFQGRLEDWNRGADRSFRMIVKDDLALIDREVPAQISDDNLVAGVTGATDPFFSVDSTDEVTDPSSLASKDFFPVVLRLDPEGAGNGPEDIIIKSIPSVVNVQDNYLTKSEDFSHADWTKSGGATVTADQVVPPLGGPVGGDRLDFAATGDQVEQDSGEAASGVQFTFSVWLRGVVDTTAPAVTPPYNMTLDLILDDASELTSATVEVTEAWTRHEVTATFTGGAGQTAVARIRRAATDQRAVYAWGAQLEKSATRGFYAATDTTAGDDAGRGAFGTTAVVHADNTPFIEVIPYRQHLANDGVHPVVILRDLVNRGQIAVADVDQDSFDAEFAFVESVQGRRSGDTLIQNPAKLSEYIKEVREQFLLDLWVSEQGLVKTRLSYRTNTPSEEIPTLTDEANIVKGSATYLGNKESRVTRALCHYNPQTGETDPKVAADFQNHQVTVNLGTEALSGERARALFSKWIFRSTEAVEVTGRLVARFRRGARIANFDTELKDASSYFVGNVVTLNTDDLLEKSGTSAVRADTFWQVTQKEHQREAGRVRVRALEFSGRRYGIISPDDGLEDPGNPFPDYDSASARERQYGFIGTGALGDDETTVGTPTSDGYYLL